MNDDLPGLLFFSLLSLSKTFKSFFEMNTSHFLLFFLCKRERERVWVIFFFLFNGKNIVYINLDQRIPALVRGYEGEFEKKR